MMGCTASDFSAQIRGPDDVDLKTEIVDDGAPNFGVVFQPNGTSHVRAQAGVVGIGFTT